MHHLNVLCTCAVQVGCFCCVFVCASDSETLVEFQNVLKDCLQRLLADDKIDACTRLQLLLLLNFAHEFMIAGFYAAIGSGGVKVAGVPLLGGKEN